MLFYNLQNIQDINDSGNEMWRPSQALYVSKRQIRVLDNFINSMKSKNLFT